MKAGQSKNISGRNIASIRKDRKLTQAELAVLLRRAGLRIDRAAIAKIENDLRGVYDYELHEIALILKVPVSRLFPSGK